MNRKMTISKIIKHNSSLIKNYDDVYKTNELGVKVAKFKNDYFIWCDKWWCGFRSKKALLFFLAKHNIKIKTEKNNILYKVGDKVKIVDIKNSFALPMQNQEKIRLYVNIETYVEDIKKNGSLILKGIGWAWNKKDLKLIKEEQNETKEQYKS